MEALRYLFSKKVYLLVNLIILGIGYYFIDKGISAIETTPKSSNVYVSIGTSLVATGIVVFLDLWKNFSIGKLLEKVKVIINEAGVLYIYKKRDVDRYDSLISELSESLDICGYSLGGFFDSFNEIVLEKVKNKNVKVRVLFVGYNSEASKKRAEIEGKSMELFKQRFEAFRNYFNDVDGLEIKTIDVPLGSMIYRIDDVMFVGPHFYRRQSKSTLTVELSKGKWMFDEYQQEFDRMWNDAKSI